MHKCQPIRLALWYHPPGPCLLTDTLLFVPLSQDLLVFSPSHSSWEDFSCLKMHSPPLSSSRHLSVPHLP